MAEKAGLAAVADRPRLPQKTPTSRLRGKLASTLALSAAALLLLHSTNVLDWNARHRARVSSRPADVPDYRPGAADDDSPWIHIKPSRTLQWHSCFDGPYDCARLDVPMDWQEPSENDRVVLAVVRLRAKDPSAADYRGPLIFNPGGPGGSGIFALRDHGAALQTVVGDNYDIVSFDPRGIGASVPRVECWGSEQNRMLWEARDAGVIDLHPLAVYDAYARATAFSQTCQATMGVDSILRHSSTTYHARDMLEILEQMGKQKLTYWGFSYGTVLGGTFAAMYPDRIERLVSDGNVDLKEWYGDTGYINYAHDTDKVMDAFYNFCHEAGPKRCAFYANTTGEIRARLDNLIETMRTTPVIVPASPEGPEVPEFITYTELKRLISTMLYQPVRFFRLGAQILTALEQGDGSLYYKFLSALLPRPSFCSAETIPPMVPISSPSGGTDDAFPAIMCADRQVNDTVEELKDYAQRLQELSTAAGAVQITFRLSCEGWTVRPKWHFDGPFEGNTSFPILYLANIADNITPLVSARNNSAGFPGSVVLVQNSYGHTSLAAPSTCTARYIRDYFQLGKLPAENTICEADVVPFYDEEFGAEGVGKNGDELSMAIRKLSRETNWGLGFQTRHL